MPRIFDVIETLLLKIVKQIKDSPEAILIRVPI
jgi:hypothetical protein